MRVLACDSDHLPSGSNPAELPRGNCLNRTFQALDEKKGKTLLLLFFNPEKGHTFSETESIQFNLLP